METFKEDLTTSLVLLIAALGQTIDWFLIMPRNLPRIRESCITRLMEEYRDKELFKLAMDLIKKTSIKNLNRIELKQTIVIRYLVT
jgi:hypothetical protein